ncbi:transglutaminase family protein [Roseivivax isoporae]|uniref:Transglutaminase n=1 Tax=Roseivivax isoporae LMG 25204 TaxID=1449351 RepID=X7FEV9_9RHOB|nr:transglutaminase family protein [Roseivivax isoporae]ETX30601.1 transglutaminase [Roseivivax isoporae LMG 25204]
MKLHVRHETRYAFDAPVKRLVQSHRLWPADNAAQRVLSWSVDVPGGVVGASFRDGAGDMTQTVSVRGPVTELTVTVEGQIETADTAGVLKGHRELVPPSAYLTATRRTALTAELRGLSRDALDGLEGAGTLDRAHALMRAVANAIAFVPGETEPATTASEALNGGQGVCQDHTHVLIAIAQAADIPARYVTGYLLSTADSVGDEAGHAWAELWVDGLGWVGFDAANRKCPDATYVRLGSGFDSHDAAPIRGVLHGQAGETLGVSVSVSQAGQAQQQSQGAGQRQQ